MDSLIKSDISLDKQTTSTDIDSFNTYTTKFFISKYASIDDATPVIVNILKFIPINKSTKLSNIVINLSNVDITKLQPFTTNKNRIIRYISTNIMYKYIIHNYKNNNLIYVNEIFTSTFLHRYKDVDPNIRCLSFDFIVNFISLNEKLFNKHLKFVELGLKDKNDMVRKSILAELRKKRIITNKKIIIDLCQFDRNVNIRNEALKVICSYFFKDKIFIEDDVFVVLQNFSVNNYIDVKDNNEKYKDKEQNKNITINNNLQNNKLKNKNNSQNKIISNLISFMLEKDFDRILHRIFNTSKNLLEYANIPSNYKCECKCFFEIYKIKKINLNITEIFNLIQDNLNYTSMIIEILQYSTIDNIEVFINLLNIIMKYINTNQNLQIFDNFCKYLQSIQDDFQSIIQNILDINIEDIHYRYYIIKYFNISKFITEQDYLETHVFKILWCLLEDEFNINILNFKWYDKKELCNLILFIKDKIGEFDEKYLEDVPNDKISCLNILYHKLIQTCNNTEDKQKKFKNENSDCNLVNITENIESKNTIIKINYSSKNSQNKDLTDKNLEYNEKTIDLNNSLENSYNDILNNEKPKKLLLNEKFKNIITNSVDFLDDKDLFLYIYKFNEENIFEDKIYFLYKYIENIEIYMELYSKSKNKKNLAYSFFKWICEEYNNSKLYLEIGKFINSKYKDVESGFYFKNIKYVLEKNNNIVFYNLLEIFINKLNINECIVIENIVKASKFKNTLVKRIGKNKSLEEKITYL